MAKRKAARTGIRRFSLIALLVAGAFGCSRYVVSVKYQPTASDVSNPGGEASAIVGSFSDDRGTDANWLGAIRGSFGEKLKKIYTNQPVKDVVEQAFTDALQARKLLGDKQTAKVEIEGNITKFDCSAYVNSEAHAQLLVKVVSLPSRNVVFSRSYQTDNEERGGGGGFFGNTKMLSQLAQSTLNQTVDKALIDPDFIAALRGGLLPQNRAQG